MKSAYERVDEREGWMTEYNAKHKFSSPWRVREAMQSIGIGDYLLSTLETFQVIIRMLQDIFIYYQNFSHLIASCYTKL